MHRYPHLKNAMGSNYIMKGAFLTKQATTTTYKTESLILGMSNFLAKKTKVIHVFEPDDVFSDEGMMPIKSARSTKVGRC